MTADKILHQLEILHQLVISKNSIVTDSELKCEINNFVWMHANGNITLDQADDIAVKILELLRPTSRPRIDA